MANKKVVNIEMVVKKKTKKKSSDGFVRFELGILVDKILNSIKLCDLRELAKYLYIATSKDIKKSRLIEVFKKSIETRGYNICVACEDIGITVLRTLRVTYRIITDLRKLPFSELGRIAEYLEIKNFKGMTFDLRVMSISKALEEQKDENFLDIRGVLGIRSNVEDDTKFIVVFDEDMDNQDTGDKSCFRFATNNELKNFFLAEEGRLSDFKISDYEIYETAKRVSLEVKVTKCVDISIN